MNTFVMGITALTFGLTALVGCNESRSDRVGERPLDRPPSASPSTSPPPAGTPSTPGTPSGSTATTPSPPPGTGTR
jgi:hypothetical protein